MAELKVEIPDELNKEIKESGEMWEKMLFQKHEKCRICKKMSK